MWFVWLNETNQMNKTIQMNRINSSRQSRSAILHGIFSIISDMLVVDFHKARNGC